MTEVAAPAMARPKRPLTLRGTAPTVVAAVVVWLFVLAVEGAWPGELPNATMAYISSAQAQCLHDLGFHAITSYCHATGNPAGAPVLTDGPVVLLAALLLVLPGMGAVTALVCAEALFLGVALAAGFFLLRRLGVPALLALLASALYLLGPSLGGLSQFLGAQIGFSLIPAYVLADVLAIEAMGRFRGRMLVVVLALYAAVRCVAIFQDGYSFVASGAISLALWVAWALRKELTTRARLLGGGLFLGANVFAAGLALIYNPISNDGDPRLLSGLDVTSLIEPTDKFFFARWLDIGADQTRLWGDGTSNGFNYISIACVVLAVLAVVARRRDPKVVALGVAGLTCLVLSVGPQLKADTERPPLVGAPTYQSYLVPKDAAPQLPWRSVFKLPGIKTMRAAYRWYIAARFVLVLLAAIGLAALWARNGRWRWLAVALGLIAVFESMPDVSLVRARHRLDHTALDAVDREVRGPLRDLTAKGERTLILSPDGTYNDFMAGYLSADAGLRAYNVAGDKDLAFAMGSWPAEVLAATRMTSPDTVANVLRSGRAQVVIAPRFGLRTDSFAWPPGPDEIAAADAKWKPLLADPRFSVRRTPRFSTIRLRP